MLPVGEKPNPPTESYWKASNGIRLSGMPSFKGTLADTQLWQVAQFVANTDKIPDSAKQVLAPEPSPITMAPAAALANAPTLKQK
jgi:thiosulfate dehydrogenase